MTELSFTGQAPSQVARHFLELLDDVYNIHELFLEEIAGLRARIAELEAGSGCEMPEIPGCAVYLVSNEGRIQSWSLGARDLYGYTAQEIVGNDQALLQLSGLESSAGPSVTVPALPRRRKDGGAFLVHLHQAARVDRDGRVRGRLHVEIPLKTIAGGAA